MPDALIWGASSAMVQPYIVLLQEAGWRIFAAARDEAGIPDGVFERYEFAANDRRSIRSIAIDVAQQTDGLDLWLYAAGSLQADLLRQMDPESWTDVLDANLNGAYYTIHQTVHLLNEAAQLFFIGAYVDHLILPKMGAYAVAKAGLETLAAVLQKEQRRLNVTLVKPGAVATPFWGKRALQATGQCKRSFCSRRGDAGLATGWKAGRFGTVRMDMMGQNRADLAAGPSRESSRILVTGVTGYVGGRLVPRLLKRGQTVRVLVRGGAERLRSRSWQDRVEIALGDVLDPDSLTEALRGVDAAYYLIHSMSGDGSFSQRDIIAASNFAQAAAAAGVHRIIYLGGLGDPASELSEHLRSRQDTGKALRQTNIPVIEFRAGMIVGSGSLSFEMLRHLVERLPIMLAPRWVYTRTQPIAIRDVLNYLVAALDLPTTIDSEIIEIGGADILSNAEMMMLYADERDLRRRLLRVPLLTPRLSSYWVHWMTPVSARVARPLIAGLRNELIVRDRRAQELFPEIRPLGFVAALRRALAHIREGDIETLWSDALASSQGDVEPVQLAQEQGMLIERRRLTV